MKALGRRWSSAGLPRWVDPGLVVAAPVLATAAYLALITALAKASGIVFLLFPELGALSGGRQAGTRLGPSLTSPAND